MMVLYQLVDELVGLALKELVDKLLLEAMK